MMRITPAKTKSYKDCNDTTPVYERLLLWMMTIYTNIELIMVAFFTLGAK
jgi:hypothetical protein